VAKETQHAMPEKETAIRVNFAEANFLWSLDSYQRSPDKGSQVGVK